mgnify:CR=1 FL=1
MSKYEQAKRHSDWLELAVENLKQQIRAYTLDSVLAKKPYTSISGRIQAEIEELCAEIEDSEILEKTRAELSAFADSAYKQARNMVGGLTAYQFALVLSGKPVTQAQQDSVVKSAQTSPGIEEMVSNVPEPRREAYNRATPNGIYYRDVQKAISEAMKDYEKLTAGKNYVINVNPRAIAEMDVRFKKYQEDRKRLSAKGVRLVFVSGHSNCSPRCRPWQNRVYSLDGSSGSVDGKQYIPIEDAADNVTYTSKKTGRTYYAGLFAYNCNHSIEEYTGQKPIKIPEKIADEAYEIDQTQRRMERAVRKLREKDQLYMIIYKRSKNESMRKIAQKARADALKQKKVYEDYSRKMHVPIYPERLRVVSGENLYARTSRDKNVQGIRL